MRVAYQGEPGAFSEAAVLRLLSDEELWHKMSGANLAVIRRAYMPETAMARFDTIYTGLLGGALMPPNAVRERDPGRAARPLEGEPHGEC